jgi:hypothetical protein
VLANGLIPVNFSADLSSGAGNVVGSIQYQRDIEARTQAGAVQVTAQVSSTGNSGKYEFELENTGTVDATIIGIGVKWTTNGNVTTVEPKGNGDGIFTAAGSQVVTQPIPVNSSNRNTDTRRNFTSPVPLNQNQTKLFEFVRFRTADGKNAKMSGESVYVRLYFDDASVADKDLIP